MGDGCFDDPYYGHWYSYCISPIAIILVLELSNHDAPNLYTFLWYLELAEDDRSFL